MKTLRDNGLTIVLVTLSLLTIGGMLLTGWSVYDHELADHAANLIGLAAYAKSGHFLSSLFENWESEFLQMSAYVMLTAFLFQRGRGNCIEAGRRRRSVARPCRRFCTGGVFLLVGNRTRLPFCADIHPPSAIQRRGGKRRRRDAWPANSAEHLVSAQFWFESLQNWQSEFLSTAVIVVLSIFLRFRGSPESKPVAAPHAQTGA